MRIKIILSKTNKIIEFDYQYKILGCVHKWLGKDNQLHDEKLSLYTFSWLYNLKAYKQFGGFKTTPFNPYFTFSAYDKQVIDMLVAGIGKDNKLFAGLEVEKIEDVNLNFSKDYFTPQSPIFIRDKKTHDHILFHQPEANILMKNILVAKLNKANLEEEFDIQFELGNPASKIKLVNIKGIKNKVNFCPVFIKGSELLKRFALSVGLGNSTGSGFGCIQ